MNRIFLRLLMLLVLVAGTVMSTSTSANAFIGGSLYHYNGPVDTSIPVRCNYGDPSSQHYVNVGQHDPCGDMDQVYVRAGTELLCRKATRTGTWVYEVAFDATGWHKTNDLWHKSCSYRSD